MESIAQQTRVTSILIIWINESLGDISPPYKDIYCDGNNLVNDFILTLQVRTTLSIYIYKYIYIYIHEISHHSTCGRPNT